MTTAPIIDELSSLDPENPGLQLANIRQQKNYSIEYVASKLHLRARVIELIENEQFDELPEPVFIKGYIRAYCKLLGISPDPFLSVYNAKFLFEKKPERALWQSKKESHKAEHAVRWFTLLFLIGVVIAVGLWWQNNKDMTLLQESEEAAGTAEVSLNTKPSEELKLADISSMESILNPQTQMSKMGDLDG